MSLRFVVVWCWLLGVSAIAWAGEAPRLTAALEWGASGEVAYEGVARPLRLVVRNAGAAAARVEATVTIRSGEGSGAAPVRETTALAEIGAGKVQTWEVDASLAAGVYKATAVIRELPSREPVASASLAMAVFPRRTGERAQGAGVELIDSGLSPFVLARSSATRVHLFSDLAAAGLAGPAFVGFKDDHKPRVAPTGAAIDPAGMSESWLLFWFDGGKGWSAVRGSPYLMDVPILVVLQKKPSAIRPEGGGVALEFTGEVGYIALVPLYGASVVRASETAGWKQTLPEAVVKRCQALAEISREYPIRVEEQFKINARLDRITVRNRFDFLSIDDEWATPHRKIALLEPAIALAQRSNFRLLNVTGKVADVDMAVGGGAVAGVEGDETSYTLTGLLRYVNQVEQPKAVNEDDPLLAEWRQHAAGQTQSIAPEHVRYLPAGAAEAARKELGRAAEAMLHPGRLSFDYDAGEGVMYAAEASALLHGGWAGASGVSAQRVGLLERMMEAGAEIPWGERYPVIEALYRTARRNTGWGTAFPEGPGMVDSSVGGTIAMARMAWRAGDEEAYRRCSYDAARQMLALWVQTIAYPKWVREKNLWASLSAAQEPMSLKEENGQVTLRYGTGIPAELEQVPFTMWRGGNVGIGPGIVHDFGAMSEAELRFVKDRLSEPAKRWLSMPQRYAPEYHAAAYVTMQRLPAAPELPMKEWLEPLSRPQHEAWDVLFDVPPAQRRDRRMNFWRNNGGTKGRELEILLAGVERKYAPLWQGGEAPKADMAFRPGFRARGGSPAWAAAKRQDAWMLSWSGVAAPNPSAVEGLPLCGIRVGPAR